MPVLPGTLLDASLGPVESPRNSADLDGHVFVPSLPQLRSGLAARWGLRVSNLPVTTTPRALPAVRRGRAWLDDYYYRVHIVPDHIDLGNVVSTQTTSVWVWSAWLAPRTLVSIGGLAEGIEITGQPAPPLLFAPLQERGYDLSVTPDGQPVVDTRITWMFDNAEAPGVRITANRIIGWTFAPDWSDGVLERLTWATDILSSESMAEQRRALREAPRREFEASIYAHQRERQYLDMILFGWGARVWALPVWPDIQWLEVGVPAGSLSIPCDTADLDFRAGGMAMLRAADMADVFAAEVVEVDTVEATSITLRRATQRDWPAGSRLYPARSAQMTEAPTLTRHTDRLDSFDVTFRVLEPSDWPATAPALLYRGRPVFAARPNEAEELTREFARLLAELDNGAAAPLITDVGARALPVLQHRWLAHGRAARAAWRGLLYWLRGRQRACWVPTHADDLTITGITAATATTLDVAWCGYTRFGQARTGRCDIRIELLDGSAIHRRITGSTELSDAVERLALDAAPGIDLTPDNVARISYLALCRLDSDSVEIRHLTDSEGVAESELLFRGVRDDEL